MELAAGERAIAYLGHRVWCSVVAEPGARMPQFWPDLPETPYPWFNGDGEAQVRAVRDYLLTLRGGPSPRPAGPVSAN